MGALRDWYAMVLGASVMSDAGDSVFMSYDHEPHRLALVDQKLFPDGARSKRGLGHVGWAYDEMGELLDAYEALGRAGLKPDRCIDHEITRSLYYRDPDENEIELFVNMMSADEAHALLARRPTRRAPWNPERDP